MNIIEKIRNQENFTASEQEIIQLLLKNPEVLLANPTASQLGAAAYTSASTVVRLCQKLDCKSFSEFKTQFISQYQQGKQENLHIDADLPFDKTDSAETVLNNLTNLEKVAIQQTRALIDSDSYKKAVKLLNDATCIDVYGAGENVHLLQDFAYKMGTIFQQVNCHYDSQQQLLSSFRKYDNHCAILVSYSGEARSILKCAQFLRDNQTPILSITRQSPNSLAEYADIQLYIAKLESLAGDHAKLATFTTNISIVTLMNYLYAGIFQLNYDQNYQYLVEDWPLFVADR